MEIELLARHVELSDKVRDYVDKKIGRLDRYLPDIKATRVELSHGTQRSRGEVYRVQITELAPLPSTENLQITGMTLEVGRKRGLRKG